MKLEEILQRMSFVAQAFWFRIVMLAAFLLLAGVFISLSVAKLDFTPTGEFAPFAEEEGMNPETVVQDLPVDQPNRSYNEIEEWIGMAVTDALTLDAQGYVEKLDTMSKTYFSPEAFAQYKQALEASNFQAVLSSNDYKTNVFLESDPAIMSEGVVEGRYRWLFEVPVTISYLPRAQKQYSAGQNIQNARVLLRIQVGRVATSADPQGMKIDSWIFTPRSSRTR